MVIGLTGSFRSYLDSLKYFFRFIEEALREDHELIYLPAEYSRTSREHQIELVSEWLTKPALILGLTDPLVLQVRQEMNGLTPFICLLLGSLPRGGGNMQSYVKYLTTADCLMCNCLADVELASKYFANARTALLPFIPDEALFYMSDSGTRCEAKQRMGFNVHEKILFYAGRLTLEKNLHTLLRIFSVVVKVVPEARLLLAGDVEDLPFSEFGVSATDMRRMLFRLTDKLNIRSKVQFLGHQTPKQLRELYMIADLAVNVTLHHDENFGLSQVEAMACGTPVVGTNWGGLKDTIADGNTGAKVSVFVTDHGLKVDWYEAAVKIIEILSDRDRQSRLAANCPKVVAERYSYTRFRETLNHIVTTTSNDHANHSEPLVVTDFAKKLWELKARRQGRQALYRRSREAYNMYRELMYSYSGVETQVADNTKLEPNQILCLSSPVYLGPNSITVDDALFPFEIAVPRSLERTAMAILAVMSDTPLLTLSDLMKAVELKDVDVQDATTWLIQAGIVLASTTHEETLIYSHATKHMGAPLFQIESIPDDTDIAYWPGPNQEPILDLVNRGRRTKGEACRRGSTAKWR